MRKLLRRIGAAVAVLAFGIGAVAAQQNLVNEGQALMKANGRNFGSVLNAMVKGERAYDQAAVEAALAQLDDTAKKLSTLYPASTKGLQPDGNYSLSPKIWDDKASFDEHVARFGKAVSDARTTVKDLDTLKAALPAIGKQCSGCHETFRLKNG